MVSCCSAAMKGNGTRITGATGTETGMRGTEEITTGGMTGGIDTVTEGGTIGITVMICAVIGEAFRGSVHREIQCLRTSCIDFSVPLKIGVSRHPVHN